MAEEKPKRKRKKVAVVDSGLADKLTDLLVECWLKNKVFYVSRDKTFRMTSEWQNAERDFAKMIVDAFLLLTSETSRKSTTTVSSSNLVVGLNLDEKLNGSKEG